MAVPINVAGDPSTPLEYVVPGSTAFIPRAASCSFDGTGAAGTFVPVMRWLAQNGDVIGRYIAPQVAAGDTADVSWAPFLRNPSVAAAAGANLPWGAARVDSVSIASGSVTVVDFNLTNPNAQFGSSGDGTVTLGNVGGGKQGLILNTKGTYQVSWHVFATTSSAPAANSELGISCDWDTGDVIAGENNDSFTLISGGPARNFDVGVAIILDLDPANYPIPNTGRITLNQNTTLTLTGTIIQTAYMLSSVTDPNFL